MVALPHKRLLERLRGRLNLRQNGLMFDTVTQLLKAGHTLTDRRPRLVCRHALINLSNGFSTNTCLTRQSAPDWVQGLDTHPLSGYFLTVKYFFIFAETPRLRLSQTLIIFQKATCEKLKALTVRMDKSVLMRRLKRCHLNNSTKGYPSACHVKRTLKGAGLSYQTEQKYRQVGDGLKSLVVGSTRLDNMGTAC